jgi:hypothetical protein
MDDRVIPISIPNVAWQQYLSLTSEWLGHPPSKGVDSCQSRLSDFARYVASLGEFQAGKEVDAKRTLRTRGPWLQHTFFSFLVLTTTNNLLRVAESTDLKVLSTEVDGKRASVISGTLQEWRDSVILMCDDTSPKRLRLLFNTIKRAFDQIGLQDVFFEFRLKDAGDGTFLLESKN